MSGRALVKPSFNGKPQATSYEAQSQTQPPVAYGLPLNKYGQLVDGRRIRYDFAD